MGFLRSVLYLMALLWLFASPALAAGRVALVVGNSDYDNASFLPNGVRDAQGVARTLRNLGFEVLDGYNLTQKELLELAQRMERRLKPDDVALFYFSGHAIQLGAQNYILPVDTFGLDQKMVRDSSVRLQTLLASMEKRADRNIIILDACRNNPFENDDAVRSFGAPTRGLAEVDAGVNSFVAFSTQPGNVALDGAGENSPFTSALLSHLPALEDDIHEIMRKVRRDVILQTDSLQIPWENSSLVEQIFLAAPYGRQSRGARPTPTVAARPEPVSTFNYRVAGLDPNGDGFLALRASDTARSAMLAKMTEGTRLEFLGQDGVWFHVRTETGLQGWAHSNWIRFVGRERAVAAGGASPAPMSCDQLWYARNEIFARNGYCFRSARGQAAFSNAGCRAGVAAGDIRLTSRERSDVARFIALEKAQGCR